ncbi:MAG: viologen exporter family transport system permease protein [Streptomycetaceae bacterium]|jgi:ABC-2 type transport system permease protein|nr:viologen exporter family transport system permease protein [Streptomycetaceae bacterium]
MSAVGVFFADWRVARRIIGVNFRARAEYRAEFLMGIGIGVIWQVSIIVFATVLLGRFPGMGGWPSDAVLLIASMRMFSHALHVLFFGRVTYLASLVQEGMIDGYLLRPMPVHRQVQLAFFPTNAIGDVLVGVSMFTGAVVNIHLEWTPLRIGYVIAGILGGMLVEAAVFTALSSFQLHFPAASYWSSWTEELLATFGNYPLKILPGVVSGAFTVLLPLAFIAYFPAAVLTGHTSGLGVPGAVAAASPLIGLAAYVGSRYLWNWSLRHYSGVNG